MLQRPAMMNFQFHTVHFSRNRVLLQPDSWIQSPCCVGANYFGWRVASIENVTCWMNVAEDRRTKRWILSTESGSYVIKFLFRQYDSETLNVK
jgi:hypothetical protein